MDQATQATIDKVLAEFRIEDIKTETPCTYFILNERGGRF